MTNKWGGIMVCVIALIVAMALAAPQWGSGNSQRTSGRPLPALTIGARAASTTLLESAVERTPKATGAISKEPAHDRIVAPVTVTASRPTPWCPEDGKNKAIGIDAAKVTPWCPEDMNPRLVGVTASQPTPWCPEDGKNKAIGIDAAKVTPWCPEDRTPPLVGVAAVQPTPWCPEDETESVFAKSPRTAGTTAIDSSDINSPLQAPLPPHTYYFFRGGSMVHADAASMRAWDERSGEAANHRIITYNFIPEAQWWPYLKSVKVLVLPVLASTNLDIDGISVTQFLDLCRDGEVSITNEVRLEGLAHKGLLQREFFRGYLFSHFGIIPSSSLYKRQYGPMYKDLSLAGLAEPKSIVLGLRDWTSNEYNPMKVSGAAFPASSLGDLSTASSSAIEALLLYPLKTVGAELVIPSEKVKSLGEMQTQLGIDSTASDPNYLICQGGVLRTGSSELEPIPMTIE